MLYPARFIIQIRWRNQKLYRQAKAKRIQHHQTSLKTNPKGTSLRGKEKATTTTESRKLRMGKLISKGKPKVKANKVNSTTTH